MRQWVSQTKTVTFPPQVRGLSALSELLSFGIELRFWVAACVTGLAIFCHRVTSTTQDKAPQNLFLVVFLSTLIIYNLDSTFDTLQHTTHNAEQQRTASPLRRRRHLTIALFSLLALLWLLPQYPFFRLEQ